jgi:hypothetical protein
VAVPSAAELRDLAARMLALAMGAKDQRLLEWLVIRASEYLDQAMAIEAAGTEATGTSPVVQQTQQPQQEDPEKT